MKNLKKICVAAFAAMASAGVYAESSYDISGFYTVEKPMSGTKAVGGYDKIDDVEYILTPTKVDTGKYVVEVRKIGDNLYQVRNTDLCIATRYCHEYASYSEEAVLVIDSNYGYTKGKIIFD